MPCPATTGTIAALLVGVAMHIAFAVALPPPCALTPEVIVPHVAARVHGG